MFLIQEFYNLADGFFKKEKTNIFGSTLHPLVFLFKDSLNGRSKIVSL